MPCMPYNALAYTRDNAINHASVASQQFFTGTMETMRGFVFAGGGGGGERGRDGDRDRVRERESKRWDGYLVREKEASQRE